MECLKVLFVVVSQKIVLYKSSDNNIKFDSLHTLLQSHRYKKYYAGSTWFLNRYLSSECGGMSLTKYP